MVEEPISFLIVFRPRSNIGTDKSAAYSSATLRHMLSLYLPNSNSLCEASQIYLTFLCLDVFAEYNDPPPPPLLERNDEKKGKHLTFITAKKLHLINCH